MATTADIAQAVVDGLNAQLLHALTRLDLGLVDPTIACEHASRRQCEQVFEALGAQHHCVAGQLHGHTRTLPGAIQLQDR